MRSKIRPPVKSRYTILNGLGKMQIFPDGRLITTISNGGHNIAQNILDTETFNEFKSNLLKPEIFYAEYFIQAIFKLLDEYSYFDQEELHNLYTRASLCKREECVFLIQTLTEHVAKIQKYVNLKIIYGTGVEETTTQILKINMAGFTSVAVGYEEACESIEESDVSSLDKQSQISCQQYNMEFIDLLELDTVQNFNYDLVTDFLMLDKKHAVAYINIYLDINDINQDIAEGLISDTFMNDSLTAICSAFVKFQEYYNAK